MRPSDKKKKEAIDKLLEIVERKTDAPLIKPIKIGFTIPVIKQRNKSFRVHKAKHVSDFIYEKQWKKGENYIEDVVLYHLFTKWLIKKRKVRPNYVIFMGVMNLNFPFKQLDVNKFYFGLSKTLKEIGVSKRRASAIKRWKYEKEN